MNWTATMSRALDEESDALYEEAKALVDEIHSDDLSLENSQLNSLVSVANGSTQIRNVAQFVKHQAGRDSGNFDGWRVEIGSRDLSYELAEFSERTALVRAQALLEREIPIDDPRLPAKERKEAAREIAMELLRRYVSAFTVLYRYRSRIERRG